MLKFLKFHSTIIHLNYQELSCLSQKAERQFLGHQTTEGWGREQTPWSWDSHKSLLGRRQGERNSHAAQQPLQGTLRRDKKVSRWEESHNVIGMYKYSKYECFWDRAVIQIHLTVMVCAHFIIPANVLKVLRCDRTHYMDQIHVKKKDACMCVSQHAVNKVESSLCTDTVGPLEVRARTKVIIHISAYLPCHFITKAIKSHWDSIICIY